MAHTSANIRVVWILAICTTFAALVTALTGAARAQAPATKHGQARHERLSLELVPADATTVIAIRPAEIAAKEELLDLANFLERLLPLHVEQVSAPDIREVLLIRHGVASEPTSRRIVYRFVSSRAKKIFVEGLEKQYATPCDTAADGQRSFQDVDELTVVVDSTSIRPALKNTPPRWADAWQEQQDAPAVAALDGVACLKNLGAHPLLQHLPDGLQLFMMFNPLYMDVDWAVADLSSQNLRIAGVVRSNNMQVTHVRDTLQALSTVIQNSIRYSQRQLQDRSNLTADAAITAKLASEEAKLLASAEFKIEGSGVNVAMRSSLSIKELAELAVAAQPIIEESQAAARRMAGINNMKQLALGMLNYESVYQRFPAASTKLRGKTAVSKYPHSWRVAILPFLEAQPQYDQYRFDEPWDSEANKKVLAKMPDVFRSPQDTDPNSTNTSYFVFTGSETLFAGEEGVRMRNVTDGNSKTIMIVEAKRAVPWTKPEDIEYAADKPVPQLGGWVPGEFMVALGDASVQTVSADVDQATLRAYITKDGGELGQDLPDPGGKR